MARKECACQHLVLGQPQKSSDVVTRRIRNVLCPEHGRRDAREVMRQLERKAAQQASTRGWR